MNSIVIKQLNKSLRNNITYINWAIMIGLSDVYDIELQLNKKQYSVNVFLNTINIITSQNKSKKQFKVTIQNLIFSINQVKDDVFELVCENAVFDTQVQQGQQFFNAPMRVDELQLNIQRNKVLSMKEPNQIAYQGGLIKFLHEQIQQYKFTVQSCENEQQIRESDVVKEITENLSVNQQKVQEYLSYRDSLEQSIGFQFQQLDEQITLILNQYQGLFYQYPQVPQSNNPSKIQKKSEEKIINQPELEDNDQNLCIVCMSGEKTCVLIPCGHQLYCENCVKSVMDKKSCYFCNQKVQSYIKCFR